MSEKTVDRIERDVKDILDMITKFKSGEIETNKIDAVIGYIENCATSIKYALE